jgi:tRNA pseudouridine38-40 synthase
MPRFKLLIEYAGTRYSGWQIQKNARTVQGEIDRAVRAISKRQEFELYGSGRTDAGVHALAQVAHLELYTDLAPETLRRRINAFGKPFVWWIREPLNIETMRQAAGVFVGMKDFSGFTADDPAEKSTQVLVDSIEIAESGSLILIRVQGSHFLWKMVRRMVGVLAAVGRGDLTVPDVARMLDGPAGAAASAAALAAPAAGLFLEAVIYKGERGPATIRPLLAIDL